MCKGIKAIIFFRRQNVTISDKKALLQQYQNIEKEIRRQREEYLRIMTAATHITPELTGMPKGENGDRIAEAAERLSEISEKLAEEIGKLCRTRYRLLRMIGSVKDARLRLLLNFRYIDGLPLTKVAEKMNYSYIQTIRMHGKALEMIKEKKKDDTR